MASKYLFRLVRVIESRKYQKLCPNRIWHVFQACEAQRDNDDDEPQVMDLLDQCGQHFQDALSHEDHSACSFDFCEFSSRNFTAVKQYHEPNRNEDNDPMKVTNNHENGESCFPLQELFSDSQLSMAVKSNKLTAWKLDGSDILEHPRPFLAISHVWSDGTGAGTWPAKQVNECLYQYFQNIALRFRCEGIWWDAICIPQDRKLRSQAIDTMACNYEFAKLTVVHDRFLRKLNFETPERALLAIVMSPWFTRGWTALELARSRVVRVIFKDSIKDLDRDILDKATNNHMVRLVNILRNSQVLNIKDLLLVLKDRYTSWAKDRAAIAGLLTGVAIPKSEKDTFQRDTYQRILKGVKRICHGHLFHKSITMEGEFGWCATSLFKLPRAREQPRLKVNANGSVTGRWRVFSIATSEFSISDDIYGVRVDIWGADGKQPENSSLLCSFGNSHGLVAAKLQNALQNLSPDYLVLFRPDSIDEPDWGFDSFDLPGFARRLHYFSIRQGNNPESTNVPNPSGRKRDKKNAVLVRVFTTSDERRLKCQFVGSLDFVTMPTFSSRDLQPRLTIGDTTGWFQLNKSAWDAFDDARSQSTDNDEGWPVYVEGAQESEMSEPPEPALQLGWSQLHTDAFMAKTRSIDASPNDLSRPDSLGQLPLHVAAETGRYWNVFSFLTFGSPLLIRRDWNGQTPMHRAAWSGSVETINLLEGSGGNALIPDYNGALALHIAAEMGFCDVVRYLCGRLYIDAGSLPKDGLTPLHYASFRGHAEIADVILDKHDIVNIETGGMGWTPLHYAADNGHAAVVKVLLCRGAKVDARDHMGWTPLHFAAMGGHEEVADELLRNGANIAMEDANGWTPLRFAAVNGRRALVDLLGRAPAAAYGSLPSWEPEAARNNDAVVNWVKENKREFGRALCHWLYFAALDGRTSVTEWAMNYNRAQPHDGNSTQSNRWDQLAHTAAGYGFNGTLNFFYKAGIDVLATDDDGLTPLHFACKNGRAATVQWLLSKGAKVDGQENGQKLSPLHFASWEGHLTVARLLVKHNAKAEVLDIAGQTPLHLAAKGGHTSIVSFLLSNKAGFDTKDQLGHTPLHLAARFGHETLVKLLIHRGAEQTAKDSRGRTALWFAAMNRHGKIMEFLSTGRHVDAQDSGGRTPLHCAAQDGQTALLQWLVDKGYGIGTSPGYKIETLVGIKDIGDQTPLHYAASKGQLGAIRWLVKNQADVWAKDADGRTALHYAAEHGGKEMINLLIDDLRRRSDNDALLALLNAGDNNGGTPLHYAARNGHEEFVRTLLARERELLGIRLLRQDLLDKDRPLLLETADRSGRKPLHFAALGGDNGVVEQLCRMLTALGDDLEAKDDRGRTALHLAADNGNELAVERLLVSGARANAEDINRWTPLHYAADTDRECSKSIIKRIMEEDSSLVGAREKSGRTPLHFAAWRGNEAAVRWLVDMARNKSDENEGVDAQDDLGRTSLHCAAGNGNDNVVQCLLDNKASAWARDHTGMTPLHYAAQGGHVGIVKLLVDHDKCVVNLEQCSGWPPLHFAAMGNHIACVKWLLIKGASINTKNRDGLTSLHYAAESGRLAMISLLIDSRADITNVDDLGRTPLHCAALNGHDDAVELLIEKGAQVKAKCDMGATPMHFAARGGHARILERLKENNADIEVEDGQGLTPLCEAALAGSMAAAKWLLDHGAEPGEEGEEGVRFGRDTPLSIAAGSGHADIVALLLDMRADINAINDREQTALHLACMHGWADVVDRLISNKNMTEEMIWAPDRLGKPALHYAASGGFLDVVQLLLSGDSCNKYIDVQDHSGRTPLQTAAANDHAPVVGWLVENRARVDTKDRDGNGPVHVAAWHGHVRIAELLCYGGADFEARNRKGATALHLAAASGNGRTIELLKNRLRSMLELRVEDDLGFAPLHYAAQYGHHEVMDMLIVDHEDLDLAGAAGQSPLHCAVYHGQEETCRWLLSHVNSPSRSVRAPNSRGETPLHLATMSNRPGLVQLLIQQHISLNLDVGRALASRDRCDRTPLETAIHFGGEYAVEAFIRELRAGEFVQAAVASSRASAVVAAMHTIQEHIYAFHHVLEPVADILTLDTNTDVLQASLDALTGVSNLPESVSKAVANCLLHPSLEVQKKAITLIQRQAPTHIDAFMGLVDSLKSHNNNVKEAAITAFQEQGVLPDQVLHELEKLLCQGVYPAQAAAAKALLKYPTLPSAIIDRLVQCICDRENTNPVRVAAAETLRAQASLPLNVEESLVERVHDAVQRVPVLRALRRSGLHEATLKRILDAPAPSQDTEAHGAALEVLSEQEYLDLGLNNLQVITQYLENCNPRIRDLASTVFQKQRELPDETLRSIKAHLDSVGPHIDESTRTSALKALRCRLPCSDETLTQLRQFLENGDHKTQVAAIESLRIELPLPPCAHAALLARLSGDCWVVRLAAIRAYHIYVANDPPPPDVIKAFRLCLEDRKMVIRKEAARALQRWNIISDTVTRLFASWETRTSRSRVALIQVFQELDSDASLDEKILPGLIRRTEDPDPNIRQAAIEALGSHRELPDIYRDAFAKRMEKIFRDIQRQRFQLTQAGHFFCRDDLPERFLQAVVYRLFNDRFLSEATRDTLKGILHSQRSLSQDLFLNLLSYLAHVKRSQRVCAIDLLRRCPIPEEHSALRREVEQYLRFYIWREVAGTFLDSLDKEGLFG